MSGPTSKRVPDRREGIGASAVAAIMGVSPWRTPVDEWLDKVGLAAERPETLLQRAGHVLEPMVLDVLRERTGIAFRANRAPRPHPRWDEGVRLYATPDGVALPFLAECKTGRNAWEDGLPPFVRWQAVAQLACFPRAESVYVARMAGEQFETYLVERDADEIAHLERFVADWWQQHVVEGRAPDPPERPEPVAAEVTATAEQQSTWEALRDTRASIRRLQENADQLVAALAAPHADISGEGWRGKWITRTSTKWKEVATAAGADPRLVAAYTETKSQFDVRESK